MSTASQTNGQILLSVGRHGATWRSDWWVAAMMALLVVAMVAGLARRVDPKTLPVDEQPPAILLD